MVRREMFGTGRGRKSEFVEQVGDIRAVEPCAARLLAMVLRRWANAARTMPRMAGAAPGPVRRSTTSAESTRGRGTNTSRPTLRRNAGWVASWIMTDGAP